MTAADRLRARKEQITARWIDEVLREVPALRALVRAAVVDHIPKLLDALAAWMEGRSEAARAGFGALAESHAFARLQGGIDLESLAAEHATLRRVVADEVLSRDAHSPATCAALHAGLDVALHGALVRYTAARDRERELFLGILAHDLRTPLAAIDISAELLRTGPPPARTRELLEEIGRGAERMTRLIDDLLDLVRGRIGGGIPVLPRLADMGTICAEAVREARAGSPELHFELRLRGDLHGWWDAERVTQALGNLLSNAARYGAGRIAVEVCETKDRRGVRTAVWNAGAPIPPELLGRIFDPFASAASLRRDSLGLGLYIVAQIARAHGARCHVTSTAAAGTTFAIEWPRAPLDAPLDAPPGRGA